MAGQVLPESTFLHALVIMHAVYTIFFENTRITLRLEGLDGSRNMFVYAKVWDTLAKITRVSKPRL